MSRTSPHHGSALSGSASPAHGLAFFEPLRGTAHGAVRRMSDSSDPMMCSTRQRCQSASELPVGSALGLAFPELCQLGLLHRLRKLLSVADAWCRFPPRDALTQPVLGLEESVERVRDLALGLATCLGTLSVTRCIRECDTDAASGIGLASPDVRRLANPRIIGRVVDVEVRHLETISAGLDIGEVELNPCR